MSKLHVFINNWLAFKQSSGKRCTIRPANKHIASMIFTHKNDFFHWVMWWSKSLHRSRLIASKKKMRARKLLFIYSRRVTPTFIRTFIFVNFLTCLSSLMHVFCYYFFVRVISGHFVKGQKGFWSLKGWHIFSQISQDYSKIIFEIWHWKALIEPFIVVI